MIRIWYNLKVAKDKKITRKEFKVGDHMYLRVKPKNISLRMGTCSKLAPRYYGLFEVLERVGLISYRLDLPPTIRSHNVFHVSLLNKYVHDSNHAIYWTVV
jgi:hypothetical protein